MSATANRSSQISDDHRSATLTDIKRDVVTLKDDTTAYLAGSAQAGVDVVKKGTDSLVASGKQAAAKGEAAFKSACELVAERPVTAIVVAMGIGALLGRILDRRK